MDFPRFPYLYMAFGKHSSNFKLQKDTMLAYILATDVVVVFTVYIMKTSNLELLRMHRVLMYCNILFPAILCNTTCLLFIPYVILPYPVVCTLGPYKFGPASTVLYCGIFCWSGILSALSIAYSIVLNYVSVCHFWLLKTSIFNNLKIVAVIVPTLLLIGASILLPYLLLSEPSIMPSIIAMDPRTDYFLKRYSALVIYFPWNGVEVCILLFMLIYTAATIVCAGMILRIILRIRAKKSEFSKRTYRLHINVVVAITLYCLILFLQLGLPVAIFVIVVFFDVMWIMSIPYFELLLFVPICLFSMSTCLMYLAVIRTFRLAVIQMAKRIFNIRKHYAPSNTCSGQDILRRTQIPSHSEKLFADQ